MLDQLISLVKEYAGDAIITNPAIPNDRNDEAVGLASNSILDGLKMLFQPVVSVSLQICLTVVNNK